MSGETAIVVSISVFILTGISRAICGGTLFDADKSVRDGISGVVIYSLGILWYCVVFYPPGLAVWSNQPLGKLAISTAMLGIIIARLNVLQKSCRNKA